jgi:oxygen-independent coproporphyrinogen-3 oxidase
MEEIMLRVRLAEGLPLSLLSATALAETERMLAGHLIDRSAHAAGSLVLTLPGRLLADAIIRDLT